MRDNGLSIPRARLDPVELQTLDDSSRFVLWNFWTFHLSASTVTLTCSKAHEPGEGLLLLQTIETILWVTDARSSGEGTSASPPQHRHRDAVDEQGDGNAAVHKCERAPLPDAGASGAAGGRRTQGCVGTRCNTCVEYAVTSK